jgi:signal transduction histidine kinase
LDSQITYEHLYLVYKARALGDAAQTIQTAADKASKVIKALKSFVYHDTLINEELKSVDLHQNIENVVTLYQNLLKHGIELKREFTDSALSVYGHGDQLSQVWTNLIHNAIHAMEGKGILVLSTEIDGDSIIIKVKNNGISIPDEIKTRIFDPFFTTKKVGQGTGLGLHLCRKIINHHQGTLMLQSEGEWTVFVVTLKNRS